MNLYLQLQKQMKMTRAMPEMVLVIFVQKLFSIIVYTKFTMKILGILA